jgi:SAM-dependent methyltransferase
MGKGIFGIYSQYYDLLYAEKDYKGEVNYIESLINKFSPGAHKILDLGCGTGKHASLFSEKGFEVVGVDLSESMLERARQKEQGNSALSFMQGDVREFRTDQKFDVVTALFHVMSYQVTNADIVATLQTAKHHLKEGGIFIFDCWYGPAVLTDRPVVRVKKLEDSSIGVSRIAKPVMRFNDNVVEVHYEISITNKTTAQTTLLKETHHMRYLFIPEINELLTKVGLKLEAWQEWLSNNIPSEKSWNVVFVCRK